MTRATIVLMLYPNGTCLSTNVPRYLNDKLSSVKLPMVAPELYATIRMLML